MHKIYRNHHKYSTLLLCTPSFNSSSLLSSVFLLLSVVSSAHVTCFQKFRTNKVCEARAIIHTCTRFQNAVVHHQISSKNTGQGWEKVGVEWRNRASISKQKIKQNKPTNTKENRPEVWLGGVLAIKHDMPCNPPKIWYDVYQMGHWSKTVNGKIESANTRRKTVKQNSKRMVHKINTISRGRVLPAPSYTNFEGRSNCCFADTGRTFT